MNHATNPKGEKLIVLTETEYESLAEDSGDIAMARAAHAADKGAPTLNADAMKAILDGSLHPLTAWRKAAGLSQTALADLAGIRPATLNDIEKGKIDPRVSTMKKIAEALRVDMDDIVA